MINRHIFIGGVCSLCQTSFLDVYDEENDCINRDSPITYSIGGDPQSNEGFLLTHYFMPDGTCVSCELTEQSVKEDREPCYSYADRLAAMIDDI